MSESVFSETVFNSPVVKMINDVICFMHRLLLQDQPLSAQLNFQNPWNTQVIRYRINTTKVF